MTTSPSSSGCPSRVGKSGKPPSSGATRPGRRRPHVRPGVVRREREHVRNRRLPPVPSVQLQQRLVVRDDHADVAPFTGRRRVERRLRHQPQPLLRDAALERRKHQDGDVGSMGRHRTLRSRLRQRPPPMAEEYGNGSIAPPHTKGGAARVAPLLKAHQGRHPDSPNASQARLTNPFALTMSKGTPTSVFPAKAGTQGRGAARGRFRLSSVPAPPPRVLPAKAGIQSESAMRGQGGRSP